MDLLQGILSSHSPLGNDHVVDKKQIQSTIMLLIDRLDNSTLLADRKASIQSIKSFSRENREFIVEQGIKHILSTLEKDRESNEMVQLILETVLNLLIRSDKFVSKNEVKIEYISKEQRVQNGKYPSPLVLLDEDDDVFDELSIWITDEFLKNSDVLLQLVIDTLSGDDDNSSLFHLRFYCILILEALVAIRPEMSIECIIKIPTSLNVLISLLDDVNVQIKNETLLLLMALVSNDKTMGLDNSHLKSLIVFEGIFNKLFKISLNDQEHLIVKKDCLKLMCNLVKYSSMNQRIFLEDRYNLDSIVKILLDFLAENFNWSSSNEDLIILEYTIKLIGFLVEEDTDITNNNQKILFEDTKIGMILLQLSFKPKVLIAVRIQLLDCVGKLIKSNPSLQEKFGSIDVPLIDPTSSSVSSKENRVLPVYKVLISWAFNLNSIHSLRLRLVCSELLKCYLFGNEALQTEFITAQLKEYSALNDNELNIFYSILEYDSNLTMNPYKLYFVIDLFVFLMDENKENKNLLLSNSENDVNYVETITELLITHLNSSNNNIRVVLFYLQFLQYICFEDFKYVNLFLDSKLNLKQILTYLNDKQLQVSEFLIVKEFIFLLVGIVYEFSTSKSPLDRASLHKMILKTISIENYKSNIKKLYDNDIFKRFSNISYLESNSDFIEKASGLPNLYFFPKVYGFLLANRAQFILSLKQDPMIDPKEKITFENFNIISESYSSLSSEFSDFRNETSKEINTLKADIEAKTLDLTNLNNELVEIRQQLSTATSKSLDYESQLSEKLNVIELLNKDKSVLSESTIKKQEKIEKLEQELSLKIKEFETLNSNFNKTTDSKNKFEEGINKMNKELRKIVKEKEDLETLLQTKEESHKSYVKENEDKVEKLSAKLQQSELSITELTNKVATLETGISALKQDKIKAEKSLKEALNKSKNNENLIPKLQGRLKELQEQNASKLNEMSAANQSKIESLEKDLEEKDDLIVTISEELDSLNSKLSVKDQKIEELEANFISISDELDNVNLKLSEKDSFISNIENSLKEKEAIIEKMKDEYKILLTKSEESDNLLANKDIAVKDITDKLEKLKSDVALKDNEINELTNKLTHSSEEVETLKQVNSQQMSELKETSSKEIESANAVWEAKTSELENVNLELQKALDLEKAECEKKIQELSDFNGKYEKLNTSLQAKDDTIQNLEKSLLTSQDDSKSLTSELEKLKKQLADQSDLLEAKTEDFESLTNKMQTLESDLSEKQKQLDAMDISFSNAKNEIDALQTSVDTYKSNAVSTEKSVTEKEALISTLNTDLQKVKDKLNTAISDYSSQIETYQSSISTIESSLTTSDAKVASLSEEIVQKNEAFESLQRDLENERSTFETKVVSYDEQVEQLNKKISEMEIVNKELEQSSSTKHLELQELNNSDASLRAKIADLDKQLAENKQSIEAKDNVITDLQSQLDSNVATIEQLKTDCQGLESSKSEIITELETKVETLSKETESLNAEKEALTTKHETLTKENASNSLLAQESVILKKKIDEMDDTLSNFEYKLREKDQLIVKLENNIEGDAALKEEVASLRAKIEEQETENTLNLNSLNSLQTTCDKLKSDIAEKSKDNNELKSKIESLELNLKNSETAADEQNKRIESNEQEAIEKVKKLELDISTEKEKAKELGSLLEVLEKQLSESKTTILSLETKQMETDNLLKDQTMKLEANDAEATLKTKTLEDEISCLKVEISKYKDDLTAKNAEYEDKQKQFELLSTEKSEASTLVADLNAKILASQQQVESLQNEISQLLAFDETKLQKESEYVSKIAELQKQVDTSSTTNSELSQEIASLKNELNTHKTQLTDKINELNNHKTQLTDKINELNLKSEKIDVNEAESLKKSKEIEEYQSKLNEKDKEIMQLGSDCEAMKSQIASMKSQTESLEQEMTTKKAELDELRSGSESVALMSKEIENLKEDIQNQSKKLADSASQISSKNEEIEKLSKEIETIVDITSTLEKELALRDNKIAELQGVQDDNDDSDDLLLLIDDLETKKKLYKEQLRGLGGTVSDDDE